MVSAMGIRAWGWGGLVGQCGVEREMRRSLACGKGLAGMVWLGKSGSGEKEPSWSTSAIVEGGIAKL